MDFRKLQSQLVWLASMEPSDAPFVSCYADVSGAGHYQALREEAGMRSRELAPGEREHFEEAFARVAAYLRDGVKAASQGVAVFARAGARPFFLPVQFRAPLPNRVSASSSPQLFHLVELQDTYYRYLLVLASEVCVRVFEVNLGWVTDCVRNTRPEPRGRAGREWSKQRYRNHRRALTSRFFNEQIRLVNQRMLAGGYRHLVLAGSAWVTARLLKLLPKSLAASVVGVIAAPGGGVAETIEASVLAFMEQEERESLGAAKRLREAIGQPGRAVTGTAGSLRALQAGQAATLVLSRWYEPVDGWACGTCGRTELSADRPAHCEGCGAGQVRALDWREEMARLAVRFGCAVEIVNHSEALRDLGGVGCLLRFSRQAQWRHAA